MKMRSGLSAIILVGAQIVLGLQAPSSTVTLSYATYAAAEYNETNGYFGFKNIRYAAAPTGTLRWQPPASPMVTPGVQNGSLGSSCNQAVPLWSVNGSSVVAQFAAVGSEDCLFLDVYSPATGSMLPVIVWIYGGGYTFGSKDQSYNPDGLLTVSNQYGKAIFVALNYRLGAFGFLAGRTITSDGVANAGLLDQRFALEWVQKNIHLFGGDPSKVTVMGESAGGGSIEHQITAYGGTRGAPFSQAILQSAAWQPQINVSALQQQYIDFQNAANCTSLAQLRNASSEVLRAANIKTVGKASYGQFTYGPAVDGTFSPDEPGILLKQGKFVKNITVMLGHNKDEGYSFTNPRINSSAGVLMELQSSGFSFNQSTIDKINELYPEPSANTTYKNEFYRADTIITESIFTCNTIYMNNAFKNNTWSYLFSVNAALHGQDVPYTFYNQPSAAVVNVTLAIDMQELFMHFVIDSNPNMNMSSNGLKVFWPQYGSNGTLLQLNATHVFLSLDTLSQSRCAFWQEAWSLSGNGLSAGINATNSSGSSGSGSSSTSGTGGSGSSGSSSSSSSGSGSSSSPTASIPSASAKPNDGMQLQVSTLLFVTLAATCALIAMS